MTDVFISWIKSLFLFIFQATQNLVTFDPLNIESAFEIWFCSCIEIFLFFFQASCWSPWGRLGSTRCRKRWSRFQMSSRGPWLLWSHPIWYQSEYYILWPKISVCSGHLFGDLHPGKWLPSYVWKMTFQIQQSLFRRDVLLTFFCYVKFTFIFIEIYEGCLGIPAEQFF